MERVDVIRPNCSKFKTSVTADDLAEFWVKRVIADEDGKFSYICGDENRINAISTWTKGYVLRNDSYKTASKYKIVKKQGETFMILEWKSGDYFYGGQVNCCYVFKKSK